MDAIYLYNNGQKSLLTSTESEDHVLLYHKLALKLGKAGDMEFRLLMSDSNLANIKPLVSEITFERNGTELFRGELITPEEPGKMTETLKVKGALDYLKRAVVPPHQYTGPINGYIGMILDVYNSKVDQYHQIQLGTVGVADPEDQSSNVNRWSGEFINAMDLLNERVVNRLGGFFRIRVVNGVKYLDYLAETNHVSSQTVEYGKNLVNTAQSIEYQDVYTVFIPTGASLDRQTSASDDAETDAQADDENGEKYNGPNKLTIDTVNNGSFYLVDEAAYAKYGWRDCVLEFENITEPDHLKEKAIKAIPNYTSPIRNITIRAVDESVFNPDADSWYLGDAVSCPVPIMNADGSIGYEHVQMTLTERDIYALAPEDEILEFGTIRKSFSEQISSAISHIKNETETVKRDNWNLSQRIDEAEGLYTTEIEDENGKKKVYLHDQKNLNDSNLQISFSEVGIFVTSDRGATWYGLTIEGDAIVNILKAYGIEADIIYGGQLKSIAEDDNGNPITWINLNDGTFSFGGGAITYDGENLYISFMDGINERLDNLESDDETIRGEIASQGTEIMANCEEIVMNALAEYVETGDYEEFKRTVASQFKQTAEKIDLNFQEQTNAIEEIDGELQETNRYLEKHFEFTVNGMRIRAGAGTMELVLDNDMIKFEKDGEVFGWWDGVDFHTGNIVVEVNERAQFGSFAFIPRSDGSLAFLKVGD